jgi:hypothetical protein
VEVVVDVLTKLRLAKQTHKQEKETKQKEA